MKGAWIAFCVLGVVCIAAFCGFWHVRSQVYYGFDFGSVVDAIALLAVGAFIEYAYLKHSSDKRADTDLLLAILDEAKASLRVLVEKAQPCENGKALTSAQQISLTSAERDLSNCIHSIEEGLRHCKVDLHELGFEKLKDARGALKDGLTDTPYPGPYDSASLVRIRNAFKLMRDELVRVAFAINHR